MSHSAVYRQKGLHNLANAFETAYKEKLNIFQRLFENHFDVTDSFSRKFSEDCRKLTTEISIFPTSSKNCPRAIQTFLVISEYFVSLPKLSEDF